MSFYELARNHAVHSIIVAVWMSDGVGGRLWVVVGAGGELITLVMLVFKYSYSNSCGQGYQLPLSNA